MCIISESERETRLHEKPEKQLFQEQFLGLQMY